MGFSDSKFTIFLQIGTYLFEDLVEQNAVILLTSAHYVNMVLLDWERNGRLATMMALIG